MTDYPARVAGEASRAAVRAKDKQAWLDLFAEDGYLADPVGPSMLDPEGNGHHGREALSAFWDNAIAKTDDIDFRFTDSFACGDECACTGSIRTTIGGQQMDAEGVFLYRVNGEGKLASLRAYWEFDRALATLKPIA